MAAKRQRLETGSSGRESNPRIGVEAILIAMREAQKIFGKNKKIGRKQQGEKHDKGWGIVPRGKIGDAGAAAAARTNPNGAGLFLGSADNIQIARVGEFDSVIQ